MTEVTLSASGLDRTPVPASLEASQTATIARIKQIAARVASATEGPWAANGGDCNARGRGNPDE